MVQRQLHPGQTASPESSTVVILRRQNRLLLLLNALLFLASLWHALSQHPSQRQSQVPDSLSLSQLSALSESCKESLMFNPVDFSQRPSR